jgi:hypothetical protein
MQTDTQAMIRIPSRLLAINNKYVNLGNSYSLNALQLLQIQQDA